MTADERRLWTWVAIGAAIVIIGGSALMIRGSSRANLVAKADALHKRYQTIFHPDKPGGHAVAEAQKELEVARTAQLDELRMAEMSLAPALPEIYTRTDLADANARVQADLETLRQLAARTQVTIPQALPFQTGLEKDSKARSCQLAQLYLVRLAVETVLHAGALRISAIQTGTANASPGGDYAIFSCAIEADAGWPAIARMVSAFAMADSRGLGVHLVDISPPGSTNEVKAPPAGTEPPQKIRLNVTLTVLNNREAWGLAASAVEAAPSPSPAGDSSPARPRRLGTQRP